MTKHDDIVGMPDPNSGDEAVQEHIQALHENLKAAHARFDAMERRLKSHTSEFGEFGPVVPRFIGGQNVDVVQTKRVIAISKKDVRSVDGEGQQIIYRMIAYFDPETTLGPSTLNAFYEEKYNYESDSAYRPAQSLVGEVATLQWKSSTGDELPFRWAGEGEFGWELSTTLENVAQGVGFSRLIELENPETREGRTFTMAILTSKIEGEATLTIGEFQFIGTMYLTPSENVGVSTGVAVLYWIPYGSGDNPATPLIGTQAQVKVEGDLRIRRNAQGPFSDSLTVNVIELPGGYVGFEGKIWFENAIDHQGEAYDLLALHDGFPEADCSARFFFSESEFSGRMTLEPTTVYETTRVKVVYEESFPGREPRRALPLIGKDAMLTIRQNDGPWFRVSGGAFSKNLWVVVADRSGQNEVGFVRDLEFDFQEGQRGKSYDMDAHVEDEPEAECSAQFDTLVYTDEALMIFVDESETVYYSDPQGEDGIANWNEDVVRWGNLISTYGSPASVALCHVPPVGEYAGFGIIPQGAELPTGFHAFTMSGAPFESIYRAPPTKEFVDVFNAIASHEMPKKLTVLIDSTGSMQTVPNSTTGRSALCRPTNDRYYDTQGAGLDHLHWGGIIGSPTDPKENSFKGALEKSGFDLDKQYREELMDNERWLAWLCDWWQAQNAGSES